MSANWAAVWRAVQSEGPQSAVSIPLGAGCALGLTGGAGLTGGGLTGAARTVGMRTEGAGPGPPPGGAAAGRRAPQLHILTRGRRIYVKMERPASGARRNNRRPYFGGCHRAISPESDGTPEKIDTARWPSLYTQRHKTTSTTIQ